MFLEIIPTTDEEMLSKPWDLFCFKPSSASLSSLSCRTLSSRILSEVMINFWKYFEVF